ncbi:MAG: LacI family DNA-binding transcriptional regulator [Chloroflexi bacterium]|nr:LacI family DNA-binding transcriptional regulator [Chloroflexota bacterium]
MNKSTLKEIARATGYSITTVSRALGGFDDVSDRTRQVILEEAERQGYEPNLAARALQTRRTQTVGLITPLDGPRFPNPFFTEFVAGVGHTVGMAHFDLLLSTNVSNGSELNAYRRLIGGRRVDGMIVLRTKVDDERIHFLSRSNIPFVVFGRTENVDEYVFIDVDGEAGQAALTRHFIGLGHRRIAYLAPPSELMFAHYRRRGYERAMQDAGLTIDQALVVETELTERAGSQAAKRLLDLADPPTAIMTGNDQVAFAVMGAVQERGLLVGQDIAVGGFDDVSSAEHIHPGLTTVHQPIFDIAQRCATILLQLIAGVAIASRATLIEPELVIRASSGPPRH